MSILNYDNSVPMSYLKVDFNKAWQERKVSENDTMEKALMIYNPFSGAQIIPQKLDYIIRRCQENNIILQPFRIDMNNDEALIELVKAENYDFLISSGGDGTLNHLSNLILKNNINLPMGILPTGTCNDFASILNIPQDVEESLEVILQRKVFEVDVGIVNEETYFLSSLAGGVFVEVSYNTNVELKKNFGPFAYYLKALSEMANIKPFKLTIETDNGTITENVLLFLILNGKQVGGFTNFVKGADVSDGLMDIMLIKNCSHIDLAAIFFKVISTDYVKNKNVITIKTNSCKITAPDNDIRLSMDGEKGPCLPVSIKFINKALKVFVGTV